jgi:hypothetical protein
MASEIDDTLRRHTDRLMALPNVVSVGIGAKGSTPAIFVGVIEHVAAADLPPHARVPENLEGHPVVVQAIGAPGIHDSEEERPWQSPNE